MTASDNFKFQFATDGEGNYGYLGADDSFIPFKRFEFQEGSKSGSQYQGITTYNIPFEKTFKNTPKVGVNTSSYGFYIQNIKASPSSLTFDLMMGTTGTRNYSLTWFAVDCE